METFETICKRKSTRSFKNIKIDDTIFQEILYAGIQAPSPKNDQPWRFLVVGEQEKKEKIADILECQLKELKEKSELIGNFRKDIDGAFESVRVLREAPVIIFVYLDTQIYEIHDDDVKWELSAKDIECTHIMSIGAAIQNMLLVATEKGVDSLWIGDIFYSYNKLKAYLGREGCIMAAVALGYGAETLYKSSRKSLDEVVTYF